MTHIGSGFLQTFLQEKSPSLAQKLVQFPIVAKEMEDEKDNRKS